MFIFLWDDVDRVSENYHDNGGLGIIAASLEDARELLRTPRERLLGYKGLGPDRTPIVLTETPVPQDCEAFVTAPDVILEIVDNERTPAVMVWGNAGCC